jgi:hypothetical protein
MAKNIFFDNFIGEEMEFMINLYVKTEQANEDGMIIQQNPLAVRGFVLDVDDEFIYLGDTADEITRFLRKDLVAGGDIVKDKMEEQFDDLLNNFPVNGSSN